MSRMQLLDGLANDAKGYIILKTEGEQTVWRTSRVSQSASRCFLHYANEASPTLLPAHEGKAVIEFDNLCQAVNAWQ